MLKNHTNVRYITNLYEKQTQNEFTFIDELCRCLVDVVVGGRDIHARDVIIVSETLYKARSFYFSYLSS